MQCANNYSAEYIEACEAKIAIQVSAWQMLENAVRIEQHSETTRLDATLLDVEPHYFNNLALVLDCHFLHRSRIVEKKDGNPLNELRLLCKAIQRADNVFQVDNGVRYEAARSILGYQPGDQVQLNAAKFISLYLAVFADIKAKYRQS